MKHKNKHTHKNKLTHKNKRTHKNKHNSIHSKTFKKQHVVHLKNIHILVILLNR